MIGRVFINLHYWDIQRLYYSGVQREQLSFTCHHDRLNNMLASSRSYSFLVDCRQNFRNYSYFFTQRCLSPINVTTFTNDWYTITFEKAHNTDLKLKLMGSITERLGCYFCSVKSPWTCMEFNNYKDYLNKLNLRSFHYRSWQRALTIYSV